MPGRFRLASATSNTQPAKDLFSPIPSSLRNGIGDQRILPHPHEVLTSNLVSESTATAKGVADHASLQVDVFPDFRIPGNIQAGQLPCAPRWDGNDFTSQTPWDDAPTPALGTFIRASTATKTTGDAERAGTVLGKRARTWYGITSKVP
jgi:hypothetical protein